MSANAHMTGEMRTLKKAGVATRITFLIAGMAIASWAPLVPFLKLRANLNDNELGLLLMLLGTGSLVAMPLGGFIAERRGCLVPIMLCSALLCISLPILATASSIPLIAAMIFLFGAGLGGLDCVMNIHGLIVEKRSAQLLMPAFHAMYSLGSIFGVLFTTLALSVGITPSFVGLSMGIILALLLMPFLANLLPDTQKQSKMWVLPRGLVILLAFVCFSVFLAEGVILDWSAIFTSEKWGINPKYAGFSFFIFAVCMTVTRLAGEILINKFGNRLVVVIGGIISMLGVVIIISSPYLALGLLGYAIVGVGAANVVPIAFSAVGKQHIVPHSAAISIISICGYSGTLLGPGIIGVISHHTSLTVSFLLLATLLLITGLIGYRLPSSR